MHNAECYEQSFSKEGGRCVYGGIQEQKIFQSVNPRRR